MVRKLAPLIKRKCIRCGAPFAALKWRVLHGVAKYCGQKCSCAAAREAHRKIREATFEKRFWAKLDKRAGPHSCWEWPKSRTNSRHYPNTYFKRRHVSAHRVAYELHYRKSPGKFHVCHTCDNRRCCNPAHLWLGTPSDNIRDCVNKGRWNCGNRPRGDASPLCTIPYVRVQQIRKAAGGMREIGRKFGISHGTVSRNKRGLVRVEA